MKLEAVGAIAMTQADIPKVKVLANGCEVTFQLHGVSLDDLLRNYLQEPLQITIEHVRD